ncbi:hypothetical protein EDD70_2344 [Hydrogenoanaerobacterium saccharovorans]|uniref:Uncharacterized protein n=1 Tax=Hydrogenoanaerobacterium saccharovorans TaxID=474960 RepID=A0A1H8CZZ5_9FIRM|nr:hypothetical protein [Hydrogenoanaerobacterium saccharovorans]RPF43380.1 hypothetical protein EDD70_2344 [Hydrogenoanaerobacterium saccharovorans]SEM99944.1 hypothetical protein SAMN05216180_2402 [Hydrogenoanaerobacterium saccharovorans]
MTLDKICNTLLILIPIAGIARIIYCAMSIAANSDESGKMNRRIKNIIVFIVLSECLVSIIAIIESYYK